MLLGGERSLGLLRTLASLPEKRRLTGLDCPLDQISVLNSIALGAALEMDC